MANNNFQLRRTSVSGRTPNTVTLPNAGEMAINMTDQILFSSNGSTIFEIGSNLNVLNVMTSLSVGTSTANITLTTDQVVFANATVTFAFNPDIDGAYFSNSITTVPLATVTPAGSNTHVQYYDTNSSAIGGTSNLTFNKSTNTVGSPQLYMYNFPANVVEVPAPATGTVLFFDTLAGTAADGMLAAKADQTFHYRIQPSLFDVGWSMAVSTAATAAMTGLGTTLANSGALTAVTPNTSTFFSQQRRTSLTAGATANLQFQQRMVTQAFLSTGSDTGGFFFKARCGTGASYNTTDGSGFIGLHTGTGAIGNVDVNTLRTCCGFAYDESNTSYTGDQWHFMSANATAISVTALGNGFPSNTLSTDMYDFEMYAQPGTTTIWYRATNLRTSNVVYGTSNATVVPADGSLMGPKAFIHIKTAVAHSMDICYMYLHVPYG